MPTYRCTVLAGGAADKRRGAVAKAITRAHHEITGAPGYFAQVLFEAVRAADVFIGGGSLTHDHIFVHGFIREGRTTADRRALTERLLRDVAAAAETEPRLVWVYLSELPAQQMAEFGTVLPEAGDEEKWSDGLPKDLVAFMTKR